MYSKSYFVIDSRYFSFELCYSEDAIEPTPYNESNLQNQDLPIAPACGNGLFCSVQMLLRINLVP